MLFLQLCLSDENFGGEGSARNYETFVNGFPSSMTVSLESRLKNSCRLGGETTKIEGPSRSFKRSSDISVGVISVRSSSWKSKNWSIKDANSYWCRTTIISMSEGTY